MRIGRGFSIFILFGPSGLYRNRSLNRFGIPIIYLLWSLKFGKNAGNNPWKAAGLEWKTKSPPLPHNFPETPVVNEDVYAYDREEYKIEPS